MLFSSALSGNPNWLDSFRQRVGDLSSAGAYVTPQENQDIIGSLGDDPSLLIGRLLTRWNETVHSWRAGRPQPSGVENFVAFSDITKLLNTTSVLQQYSIEVRVCKISIVKIIIRIWPYGGKIKCINT